MINSTLPIVTIEINRFSKNKFCVHSEIKINKKFISYAFENNQYLIPAGLYPAKYYFSPHFKCLVILLMVPGHSFIEIHPANFYTQLKGCIAPVKRISEQGGLQSVKILSYIFKQIPTISSIQVQISNLYNTTGK